MARQGWQLAQEKIVSGQYDIVILDEFTYPLAYGWLPVDEVIDVLRRRPENVHIVITGYDAPAPLVEFADLVTEMVVVKHPYHENVEAMPGIDF